MIVGREAELATVLAFVAGLGDEGDPVLLITGEPGVGKTTLLEEVLERTPEVCHVAATAMSSEQGLAYSALVSLLLARRHDLERVPSPHREVLTDLVELGRPSGALQLGIALLALWSVLSEEGRVLLCLDDAQWCDAESARAVRFAVERLNGHGVGMLVVSHDDLLPGLEQARVLELAPDGSSAAADEWVDSLTTVLSPGGQQAFAVLALANRIAPETLIDALRALGHDGTDSVAELLSTGLATRTPSGLRPRRPLGREAALALTDPSGRRRLHLVLAEVLSDGSTARRAWHLAESGEDERACAEWQRAGDEYAERHAHLPAAQAWQHAAALTTDATARIDLLVASGSAQWDAGRPDLAVATLTRAVDASQNVAQHAEVVDLLGQVVGWDGSVPAAVGLLTSEVAAIEPTDSDRAVSLLMAAARLESLAASESAVALADRAETIAERGTDFSRLMARTIGTHVRLLACDGTDLTERLAELDGLGALLDVDADRPILELGQLWGFDLMVREEFDQARACLAQVRVAARRRGLSGMESFACAMLAEVDWRTGHWSRARTQAQTDATFNAHIAMGSTDRTEPVAGTFGAATLARTDAAVGQVVVAQAHAADAVRRGDLVGMAAMSAWGRQALGLAELAAGRPRAALTPLAWIWRLERSGGAQDPGVLWWHGDLLEALLATGRVSEARRLLDQLAVSSERTGRAWSQGILLRGRGILDRDPGLLRESAKVLAQLGTPFEAARSRLAAAEHLGDSQSAIDAGAAFDSLGATPWLVRARAVGARPASADGDGSSDSLASLLTPAELRVALTVAEGLSNREVADHLAISYRTVDAHLQSIYRKLRVRGRTHLAVRVTRES